MSSSACPHCGAANPALTGGLVHCGRCQQPYATASVQMRPSAFRASERSLAKQSGPSPWLALGIAGAAVGGLFLLACTGVFGWLLLRNSAPRPVVVTTLPAWQAPVQPAGPDAELVEIVRPDAPAPPPPPGMVEPTFPMPALPAQVAIQAPTLKDARTVVTLAAPAQAVTVGGGGRWLVLHLPTQRQLAVFDVNEAKIVRTLPTSAEKVLIAAGMDKLMVVVPDTRTVERWNLATGQKEASGTFPIKVPVVAATMGSASAGPLFIQGVDWPRLGECLFFDVDKMERMTLEFDPHGFFDVDANVMCRAAANGRAFASHCYSGLHTCVLNDNRLRRRRTQAGEMPVPNPDGQVLHTTRGRLTLDLHPLGGADRSLSWPAHSGPHYLTLAGSTVTIRTANHQPAATISAADGIAPPNLADRQNWSLDKRIHFIPQARLLVTIPPSNNQLVLRRVTLNER